MLRKLVSVIAILVGLFLLAGSANNVPAVAAQTTGGNNGTLRLVNAMVGIGSVDVFLDNERVTYGLQPKDATPYFFVKAGNHRLTVRVVGGDELSIPITDGL